MSPRQVARQSSSERRVVILDRQPQSSGGICFVNLAADTWRHAPDGTSTQFESQRTSEEESRPGVRGASLALPLITLKRPKSRP
jgi:hypothetical protein